MLRAFLKMHVLRGVLYYVHCVINSIYNDIIHFVLWLLLLVASRRRSIKANKQFHRVEIFILPSIQQIYQAIPVMEREI